jgi:hypothetical protein
MDIRKVLAVNRQLDNLMEEMQTIDQILAESNHFMIYGRKHNATKDRFEIMVQAEPLKLYCCLGDPDILKTPALCEFVIATTKLYFLIETDQLDVETCYNI